MHEVGDAVTGQHHATAAHRFLVHGKDNAVRGNNLQIGVVIEHPLVYDIAQFIGVVSQCLAHGGWVVLVVVDYLLQHAGTHSHALARTFYILQTAPVDGHCGTVIGGTLHLVNVPVGLQIRKVADTGVCAHAFSLLAIPKREGIVVAIGEYNGMLALVQRLEIVLTEVATSITSATVVVVPGLSCHLDGYKHTQTAEACTQVLVAQNTAQRLGHSGHAHTTPNGKGIERTGISIVAFAGLHGSLVQINDNGQTGHKEQEEHHPELLFALATILLGVAEKLPEKADESQNQGQAIEDIASLVLAQFGGKLALVAQTKVIKEGDTGNPVAMFPFAMSLNVILTAGKIPHKIAPVHEIDLIAQEETYVLKHGGHLNLNQLATTVIGDSIALNPSQPTFIVGGMALAVHSGEEHILRIDIVNVVTLDDVAVLFLGTGFFLALVNGRALLGDGGAILAVALVFHLAGILLSVEQRTVAILLTAQIAAKRENVLGTVLVHGCVGRTSDYNYGIRAVSNHNHEHAKQAGVHEAGTDPVGLVHLSVQHKIQKCQHKDSDKYAGEAMAVEGNSEHTHAEQIRKVHAQAVALDCGFPNAPQHNTHQKYHIDDHSGVEGKSECVDKEQFEPSAHLYNTRHNAVKHCRHQGKTAGKGNQRASGVGIGITAEIIYQHKCRQTKQVKQVYADTKTRQIGYENEPAV